MNRCRRRLFVIFGGLLLAALAFLPVRSTTVVLDRDPLTNAVLRTTSSFSGYLFAPAFLRRRDVPFPDEKDYVVRYALRRNLEVGVTQIRLNTSWLLLELGLLGLVGTLDEAIFCRRRLRRARFAPLPGPPVPRG